MSYLELPVQCLVDAYGCFDADLKVDAPHAIDLYYCHARNLKHLWTTHHNR